jgi:hypothetical protein
MLLKRISRTNSGRTNFSEGDTIESDSVERDEKKQRNTALSKILNPVIEKHHLK